VIAWFARNDVAANLLMATVLICGLYALFNETAVEVMPSNDPDEISISVTLRGATPEDTELGVAIRIEEALEGLEGVRRISSTSREGGTTVSVEVDQDYDPRDVLDEVKSRVDAINTFPGDAENPRVRLSQRSWSVISVVVSGDFIEEEIRRYAEQVRDELARLPAVSQVSLDAVRNYEIAIEASQDQLRNYDLSLADVARAIRDSSLDISAGNLRTQGGDVLIRSKGQAYRRSDFENIVVKTNEDGSIIRVVDVAEVKDGFQEDAVKTVFDGSNAAMINVARTGKESALEIADAVKTYIERKQPSLPVGMHLSYWDDDSQQLKNRLGVLGTSALQGSILILLLLGLFLRPKIAFWVFIGVPISFLGAFTAMAIGDITLNLMSAFGFIVVLGIVVDDAIVTGESIYRQSRLGDLGVDAAINGTRNVAIPVTFGVLTTMVAFAPLGFLEGRFGRLMGPVAAVVICVLLFSLIESKLVLPAHLKRLRHSKETHEQNRLAQWQRRFADGFESRILKYYRPALDRLIEHRYATLAAFVGVLFVVSTLISSGWTGFTFMERIEGETARASLTMPVGTQFQVTDRHVQHMLATARQLQSKYTDADTDESAIRHVLASTGSRRGGSGSQYGRVQVELVPPEKRTIEVSTRQIIAEWRRMIGIVPGAESLNFRADFFRAGDPIDVQLSGASFEEMSEVAEQIKDHLATYPTVYEIADTLSDGKEELRIELTQQGHVMGLTRNEIVSQVGQAFKGFEAQRIQRGRDDIRVLVRLPANERSDYSTLDQMLIRTPTGREVPLGHVATLTPGKGPEQIERIDRFRTMNITAEVEKQDTNMTVLQGEIRSYVDTLLARYPGVVYEMEGEAREQRESVASLQVGVIIVLLVIYGMLALPLKSYSQPIVIMSVIPFGLIGAVAGHWVMGYTLSMLSMLGLMALTGVVVNDSLVLVDAVNKQVRNGKSLREAVLDAGVIRFRPIMLTSMTTFLGLSPLLFEKSTTAQFLIPMAISLGFGILFATAITLVLVPVNILILRDLKAHLYRALGWELRADSAVAETPS
jgi:multidrug efflux pump subunit AcrB